jgi:hypothetical protein
MSDNFYIISNQAEVSARLKEITGKVFNIQKGDFDFGEIRDALNQSKYGGVEAGQVEISRAQIGSQKGVCLIYHI